MQYRADIDGLRAFAVIAVIIYHSKLTLLGGYVGVDVFFVISGYLITTLLIKDISTGQFSFSDFYLRRAARLLPSLFCTLLAVLIFGFFFYSDSAFDKLGKDVFFSALGLANIHFAQGTNYFAQDVALRPLLHLWSLGVEEQFYVVWPLLLLITHRLSKQSLIGITIFLGVLSLAWSEWSLSHDELGRYFLPHYRAFELILGACCSFMLTSSFIGARESLVRQPAFYYAGFSLILSSAVVFDDQTAFPGLLAVIPCVGTALMIVSRPSGPLANLMSHRFLVLVGLSSYPLYLYHQPIISFTLWFIPDASGWVLLFLALGAGLPLAWLTYKFIEKPIRGAVRKEGDIRSWAWNRMLLLLATVPLIAAVGLVVAQTNGLPKRFELLNPFALQVINSNKSTFHRSFNQGAQVNEGKYLFLGDSTMQQYIEPLVISMNLQRSNINLFTRGGCVLLKGVEFQDKFADISCNDLRTSLYSDESVYEKVFLSQSWRSYDDSVQNFDAQLDTVDRWAPFLKSTIEHFERNGADVIIIGPHLEVLGTQALQPTLFSSAADYRRNLGELSVPGVQSLAFENERFEAITADSAMVIHPSEIFCHDFSCALHDGEWSYFKDETHITAASSSFVISRLKALLSDKLGALAIP